MTIAIATTVRTTFDEAVLTEIDMTATLKSKLNEEMKDRLRAAIAALTATADAPR